MNSFIRKSAQESADFFQREYVVFIDTAGKERCERYDPALSCHTDANATRYSPIKQEPIK